VDRRLRLLVGVALLALNIPLALYGLLAVLYRGDGGGNGDTYVTLDGHQVDARLVGAIALSISFIVLVVAWMILRRPRRGRFPKTS
jgi:hypothetical protein